MRCATRLIRERLGGTRTLRATLVAAALYAVCAMNFAVSAHCAAAETARTRPFGATSRPAESAEPRPTAQSHAAPPVASTLSSARRREVAVTLLGKSTDVRGIDWPNDPHFHGRGFCADLAEPCDLVVHLPHGKDISLRTRPILVVYRDVDDDSVFSIDAPPEGKEAPLAEKVRLVEDLMARWHAKPSHRTQESLRWLKGLPVKPDKAHTFPTSINVGGADLDASTDLMVTFNEGFNGKWNIVVTIGLNAAEMERRGKERAKRTAAKPSTQPVTPSASSTHERK